MNVREFNWPKYLLDQMGAIRSYDFLVVHHSASGDVSAETIDKWHKNNGYIGIGYHYVIRQDGSVEKGRPDDKAGAQCYGYNDRSLGVCLAGDFTAAKPTPAQFDTLVSLLTELKGRYPAAKVMRHSDLCSTSCPGAGFPWDELQQKLQGGNTVDWKQQIINEAKSYGLITEDHDPDEAASKWFVLAIAIRVLKKLM